MHTTRCEPDVQAAAERFAAFHRLSWRQALGRLTAPALRLHQYRDLHTRMLRDALRDRDCGPGPKRMPHCE